MPDSSSAEPPEICQLSDSVANQIAAGEVIERPAAVVKELVENSLDAGARRIVISSEDGGRRLIEISDDGHGMRPGDLRLSLARHATSKLRSAEDLFRIASLGFRGEALPSIAAVSELELASRPRAAEAGAFLRVSGGRETATGPCAMPHGTRVSVRNLFFNVPARLKFLKSEASETGHITDQATRLALAHPHVAFRLIAQGAAVFDLPAVDALDQRIRALFGDAFAASLIAVSASGDTMQLSGFVAHPREARPTSKRQFVFLNGRFVRDKLLFAAIREGFKGVLEPRLHGAVVLHLDIDPAQVDVNVHPAKSEVRFRNEGEVFALVSRTLHAELARHHGGFSLLTPGDAARVAESGILSRHVIKPATAPPPAPTVVIQERYLPAALPTAVPASPRAEPAAPMSALATGGNAPAYDTPPRTPLMAREADPWLATAGPAPARSRERTDETALPGFRRVMQLNDMFLLIETEQGIRLVDQHALHEKALFLALDPTASDLLAGGIQDYAVPLRVPLSAAEVAALAPLLPELAEAGIAAVAEPPAALAVHAHPARLRRLDWVRFFADLAADSQGKGGSDAGSNATASLRERIAHRAACHAAIKAGQRLSHEEMIELVRLLFTLDGLEHCPHGRPTTLDLSWQELARRFQR